MKCVMSDSWTTAVCSSIEQKTSCSSPGSHHSINTTGDTEQDPKHEAIRPPACSTQSAQSALQVLSFISMIWWVFYLSLKSHKQSQSLYTTVFRAQSPTAARRTDEYNKNIKCVTDHWCVWSLWSGADDWQLRLQIYRFSEKQPEERSSQTGTWHHDKWPFVLSC